MLLDAHLLHRFSWRSCGTLYSDLFSAMADRRLELRGQGSEHAVLELVMWNIIEVSAFQPPTSNGKASFPSFRDPWLRNVFIPP